MTQGKLTKIFQRIPDISTPRLYMRKIRMSDADDMYEYSSLEAVTRYLLWSPHPSREYTFHYLSRLQSAYRAGEFYDWGLEWKETGKFIGTCGFTSLDPENRCGEIGYVLNPSFWGMGIAAESAEAVLKFAFEYLSLNRIEARFMEGNFSSRRVMEKCGMQFEGTSRQAMLVKGEYRNIGTCSILRSEYFSQQKSTDTIQITERQFRLTGWF